MTPLLQSELTRARTFAQRGRRSLSATILLLSTIPALSQNVLPIPPVDMSTAQILERMEQHDHWQAEELENYHAVRHYTLEYRGFLKTDVAKMDVELDYSASSGEQLQIISQTGSRTLCEMIQKFVMQREQEASLDKSGTGMTEANYRFHLVGTGSASGRPAYILNLEPITTNKLLYRGRIWVDAKDFAVVKLEGEPALNPSPLISRTSIHHTNANVDGFWLPELNRSESMVRIGGKVVLTIDYGTYRVFAKGSQQVARSH